MNPIEDRIKQAIFDNLRVRYAAALELHKNPGRLWGTDESGREWSNVTDHCLMEAARVEVLADLLKLSPQLKYELGTAATLHDFYKRVEKIAMKAERDDGGTGRVGSDMTIEDAAQQLRNAGFPEKIIAIATCVGAAPKQLFAAKQIVDKSVLSDDDIARLAIYYVDGYTRGSMWVEPARSEAGKMLNEVDYRCQRNLDKYGEMEQRELARGAHKGFPIFENLRASEAGAIICHQIEQRFVELIHKRSGEVVEPLRLPETIDEFLRIKNSGLF